MWTMELESEKSATVLERRVAPIASRASYTTLSSLNVMCLELSVAGQEPDTKAGGAMTDVWAPRPKLLASVKRCSVGVEGSHKEQHSAVSKRVQKWTKARYA